MHSGLIKNLGFMLLIGTVIGCSYQQTKKLQNQPLPQWPASPLPAKVTYVKDVTSAEDLGIKKSFWQRLGEFFVGEEERQLVRPMAVISVKRKLYIADPGVKGVHLFDSEDNSYRLLTKSKNQALISPVAMTSDTDGNVYLTDSGLKKVFRLNSDDDIDEQVFVTLDLDAVFEQPTGLAFNKSTNELYVVDTQQHQVMRFNLAGEFVGNIGRRGTEKAEFNFPTLISINENGTLLVTDSLNFRVQMFNKSGGFVRQYSQLGNATGYQVRPKGVASDRKGNIYVVDSLFHNVQIYNTKGEFLLTVGEQGQLAGQFWLPTGIYIDTEDKIYIADSHNHRVQILQVMK